MKADRNNKKLDELISQAIGRESPKFDFDKWKQSHKKEIQVFESQTAEQKASQPVWIFETGRTIMKSRIARPLAAAIIVIGVITGISYFGGSPEFNQAAWGKMMESMKKMPWMHVYRKMELYDEIENWTCFDPSIMIDKYSDGKITYSDYSKGEGYYYKPGDKTITISPITEKYNVPGPKSPFEIVTEFFEMTDKLGAEIWHKYSRVNGQQVEIIESKYVTGLGQCHTQMIRDVQQNLLRSSQTTILITDTNEQVITTETYDYPESGPRDIYEAGAPRDAEVIDLRIADDAKSLLNEVQRRYDHGYGNCIAMVLQSWVNEDLTEEPWSIIMFRQSGRQYRMDLYYASDIKRFENLHDQVKDDWPDLTIEQVKSYERNEATERQSVYDGTYTTNRFRNSRDNVTSNRHKGMIPLDYGDSINSLSWFEPPIYGSSKPAFKLECELLESDSEHEGLIGLRITKLPTAMSRTMAQSSRDDFVKNDPVWTNSNFSLYWLDPSRDYLVIEHIEQKSDSKTINLTLETKQTPSGQWYPSHIRYESTFTLPDGKQRVNRIDKRIFLDTETVFPEGMFEADYIFNAQ